MGDALTRKQVAARLGVGTTTVRRMEDDGTLNPTRGEGETRIFDPIEVERVRVERARARGGEMQDDHSGEHLIEELENDETDPSARGSAELAALIFGELRAGVTPVEIVIAHQLDPQIVGRVYRQYVELSDLGASLPEASARIAALEQNAHAVMAVVRRQHAILEYLERHLRELPAHAAVLRAAADAVAPLAWPHAG